ncbi:glycosyltransferase family 69 protein [Myxozyma melibiosi]|uniref:Glycosyltransferase family 69 protein n=1 Tax=Myxozyma melibiosi TaxID=54550 RepID=A0ABR1FE56_9ASCO
MSFSIDLNSLSQWPIYSFISHYRLALLFWLLPTLLFRLHFLILTHNSLTLSAFAAFVFIYLPIRLISTAVKRLRPPRPGLEYPTRRLSSDSNESTDAAYFFEKAALENQALTESPKYYLPVSSSPSSSPARGRSRRGSSQNGTGLFDRFTLRNVLLLNLSIAYILVVYTLGLASPFPGGDASSLPYVAGVDSEQPGEAYFIAANFYNTEKIMPLWTAEMLRLIDVLGEKNVYLSFTENDSRDNTASQLLHLTRYLSYRNIPHSLNITTAIHPLPHKNPWIDTPHRIEYMTEVRNTALEPLRELSGTALGRRIERIIFINDVIYHHTDVLKLLAAIEDPSTSVDPLSTPETPAVMACGMDMEASTLYDQWALRDRCGNSVNGLYPYFSDPRDRTMVSRGGVVEVGTCWNGIVAMHSGAFMSPPREYIPRPTPGAKRYLAPVDDTSSAAVPLRFPQPPQSCIISECTLLPLSLINSYRLSSNGAVSPRIVVDTSVVVAYDYKWWWLYAYFSRTPIIQTWITLVERPILRVWESFGFADLFSWKELKDACYPSDWTRCNANEQKFLTPPADNPPFRKSSVDAAAAAAAREKIVLNSPMPVKTKAELQRKRRIRIEDLEKKKAVELRRMREKLADVTLY